MLFFPDSKVATDFDNGSDWSRAIAIQPDGKIVVAGYSENASYSGDFAVARYNTDGSLDTSFDGDGRTTTDFGGGNDHGNGVAIQPDGKIVVAGYAYNGVDTDFAVARYNTDGSLDTSFGGDGRVTTDFNNGNDYGNGVAIRPDGKIVVAGYSETGSGKTFAVACYNTDGSLDASFDGDGRVTTDFGSGHSQGNGIAIQPDGKIVVVGYTDNGIDTDFAVARYNIDGTLDTSFGGTGMVTTAIGSDGYDYGNAVAIQPDGKIIVAGHSCNGFECFYSGFAVVRYNIDGSLDTAFDGNGMVAPYEPVIASSVVSPPTRIDRSTPVERCDGYAVALQPDGKIVVVGGCSFATSVDSGSYFMMTRYNIDGSPDTTFSEDGTVTLRGTLKNPGQAVAIQSDGKIVVAGRPSSADFGVVRFNIDGSLDPSFDGGGGCEDACFIATTPMVDVGYSHTVGLKTDGTVVAAGDNTFGQCYVYSWTGIARVAAGDYHSVGLKTDGTVVAAGDNSDGQCEVSSWSGIVQVAAGGLHTLGLRTDDTVVATGSNIAGQCDVSSWTGVAQVDAGGLHTLGLKTDGTVVAAGDNYDGQCDVSSWAGIAQVAAGGAHTVGLRADGTVVASGANSYGQCDVSSWTGIDKVAAGYSHTVGLRTDGTVVATGDNSNGQCDVSSWTGIVQVSAGGGYTMGLKKDGTVVVAGNNPGWIDAPCDMCSWSGIARVAAGQSHTVGLKTDGTVVAAGGNSYGQCNVSSWTGIDDVAAGEWHTVGLKTDGTVMAAGDNSDGQCDVSSWTGITQVSAGEQYTVGLKTDGTVEATGANGWGQCDVSSWTGIAQVAARGMVTVGLKSDGTVLAVGYPYEGQCDVSSWTGIAQVAVGSLHTVGLKTDGTVVATGHNEDGQCDVSSWTGITQVAAGYSHTVGLKTDATVVAAGDNTYGQCDVSSWTGIAQVSAGLYYTVGLKADGTVVAICNGAFGQCNVGSWLLGPVDDGGGNDGGGTNGGGGGCFINAVKNK